MKTLTIKIPTSYKELQAMLKERGDKRYKHNVDVLSKFAYDIISEINSNYWNKDINYVMKKKVSDKISQMFHTAKHNLK
ncbi:hypothetical protein [Bacteroides caccae]|uniref:hypothetical protein n=1 Tax=Bacteroides caccae TaxID=47678 RepID=UPI003561B662